MLIRIEKLSSGKLLGPRMISEYRKEKSRKKEWKIVIQLGEEYHGFPYTEPLLKVTNLTKND